MRIVIEIDGGEVAVKTYPSQTPPPASIEAPAALPTLAGPAPPPEVLRAAAALGAIDAGPAPTGSAFVAPIQSVGEGASGAGTHDVDAGAAPGNPSGGSYGPR